MRTIRLNGELGKKYGRVHKLDVMTPAEAIRALCANYPEMQQDIIASSEKGVGYKCIADKAALGEEELHYPMSRSFSITPVVAGAGKIGSIILGVALIAASFVMPAFTPVFSAGGLTFGFSASATFWLGAALTLGGVAQLLSPVQKPNKDGKTNQNDYFSGIANTNQQGVPVPIGYGRAIVGSVVVSAAITVEYPPAYEYYPYIGGYNIP